VTAESTPIAGQRAWPLLADPRIAAIPVRDNSDPLVELVGRGIACADLSPDSRSGRMVRSGLAERLGDADRALPRGLRLQVAEGFRTATAQQSIIDRYTRTLRDAHPGLAAAEITRLSSRFVAPRTVAPHVAGAAVDVTIVDSHGRRLDMGTPIDATPEQSGGSCYFDAVDISPAARANRDVLATALRSAGLVNYPTEWWHWSFGDRYWAYVTGAPHAIYGVAAAESSLRRGLRQRPCRVQKGSR
jgi:D-alanyl-D-alanine dipeptidase